MNILVSACLLGIDCRYSGDSSLCSDIVELGKIHNLVPVCPEQLAGLPTPRKPAEMNGDSVIDCEGRDVTDFFSKGAGETLKIAELCKCSHAILKERSPSCGSSSVYDGTFMGQLKNGMGVTAAALCHAGVKVYSEERISVMLDLELVEEE